MRSELVLVVLAVTALANGQKATSGQTVSCGKQIKLEAQCMLTIESSPEARMIKERKKQAIRECLADYPMECHADKEAAHECIISIAKTADTDPELIAASEKSIPAIDECFQQHPPSVKEGLHEIFMPMKPHHGPPHGRGHRNASSSSEEGKNSSSSSSSGSKEGHKKKGSSSSSGSASKERRGKFGGKSSSGSKEGKLGEKNNTSSSGSASKERLGKVGGKSNSNSKSASKEGKIGGKNNTSSSSSSSSGSKERIGKIGGKSNSSESASKENRGKVGGKSSSSSSGSKERGGKMGGKGGGKSKSGSQEKNPKCKKTKQQKRCIREKLDALGKDADFIGVMDTLIRQKHKCQNLVNWSCKGKSRTQRKCIFQASKPCQEAVMGKMVSCMMSKGFTLPPQMVMPHGTTPPPTIT